MRDRAPKLCLTPGCMALATRSSYCLTCRRRQYRPYNDSAYKRLPLGRFCEACGVTTDLTKDHVIPVSKGGTNEPANIRTLCRSCNSSKKDADV